MVVILTPIVFMVVGISGYSFFVQKHHSRFGSIQVLSAEKVFAFRFHKEILDALLATQHQEQTNRADREFTYTSIQKFNMFLCQCSSIKYVLIRVQCV